MEDGHVESGHSDTWSLIKLEEVNLRDKKERYKKERNDAAAAINNLVQLCGLQQETAGQTPDERCKTAFHWFTRLYNKIVESSKLAGLQFERVHSEDQVEALAALAIGRPKLPPGMATAQLEHVTAAVKSAAEKAGLRESPHGLSATILALSEMVLAQQAEINRLA